MTFRTWIAELLFVCAVFTIVGLALAITQNIWAADWAVPLLPLQNDTLVFAGPTIKGVLQHGSYGANPNLGYPEGAEMRDFPGVDRVFLLLLKGMSCLSFSWERVLNTGYVLSYFFSSLFAAFALRLLNISRAMSLVGGVLFGFSYFHTARNYSHLPFAWFDFLMCFSTVLALRLGSPRAFPNTGAGSRLGWLALSAVLGLTMGVYYAMFSLIMLGFCFLTWWLPRKGERHDWVLRAMLIGVFLAGFLVQVTPTLSWVYAHGLPPNVHRNPVDSELYALKWMNLIVPRPGHRWEPMALIEAHYANSSVVNNETTTASLGVVAIVPFLVAMGSVLLPSTGDERDEPLPSVRTLGRLIWFVFLVATVGGIGSLIAHAGFAAVRSYARVSIVILFLALAVMGRILDRGLRGQWRNVVAALLVGVGLWDATTPYDAEARRLHYARTTQYAQFVSRVESALPIGAAVLQLPDAVWPENGPVVAMADYEHLRGYLYSKSLKWSFGASSNRPYTESFHKWAKQDIEVLLPELFERHFSALWLDLRGYPADQRDRVLSLVRTAYGESIGHDEATNVWVFRTRAARPE